MTPQEARASLINAKWSEQAIEIWLRASGRCEYCNSDLLAESGIHFHGYHHDHILPKAGDSLDNLALACIPCNRIKRATTFGEGYTTLPRKEKIERAKSYIHQMRARDTQRLRKSVEWLKICGLIQE